MYLGSLSPFAVLDDNAARLAALELKFQEALLPALRESARTSIASAKASLRVRELYDQAIAAGLNVTCPDGYLGTTRESVAAVCRHLLASGLVDLSDPILQGVDLG